MLLIYSNIVLYYYYYYYYNLTEFAIINVALFNILKLFLFIATASSTIKAQLFKFKIHRLEIFIRKFTEADKVHILIDREKKKN